MESLIKQLINYAIATLGFSVAVNALGFDPTTVADGIELMGVLPSFASREVLSDLVSALLLLPTYNERVMLGRNPKVFTSRIINNTACLIRHGKLEAWVGYDTHLKLAVATVCDAAGKVDGVPTEPAAAVRADDLGQSDVVLEITFWTDLRHTDGKNTALAVREAVAAAFPEASKPAGTGCAIAADEADREVAEALELFEQCRLSAPGYSIRRLSRSVGCPARHST